jgi:peroxiredoxin
MSEPDPVVVLLKELDRPVVPRPEFSDALRARLLAELAQPDGVRARRRVPRLRLKLPPPRRRTLFAGAVALAVAAAAIATVLLSRPSPASALDVIEQAQRAIRTVPPFEATLRFDINPDGSLSGVPKGATATIVVSYGGPKALRTRIVSERPGLLSPRGPGSYDVYDGRRIGSFDAHRKIFNSFPVPAGFALLEFLGWQGDYPDWERVCRGSASKVLPDQQIAGRDARHLRCIDATAGSWQLWIDRETGLMLKVVGQIGGGGDFFLDSEPRTSAKGGFEVEHVRYKPSFPADTFKVASPQHVLDYQGRLQTAMAKVPPFRAVVDRRLNGRTDVWQAWWLNEQRWRENVLAGRGGGFPLGAGSFVVRAGGPPQSYNAHDSTYSGSTISSAANPILNLLPQEDRTYTTTGCPIVGRDRIAGRDTVRRRCSSYDVWLDTSTGLLLRQVSPGYELRVRSIDYRPTFPQGTFRFVPPHGARSADQLANDPYYKTTLAPGKTAPNWSAKTLAGRTFSIAGLRGKPALLLLFSDTCPAGDPACDVFSQLERVYQREKKRFAIVWVDYQGNAEQARKIVQHNHLTVPVVVDAGYPGAIIRAWNIQAYPYWLLLDTRGRVIEARFKPQTIAQLEQLVAKAQR